MATAVIDMVAVEQREEHVYVEQRPFHSGSSSRSRSMSAFEIATPRGGRGTKPWWSVPLGRCWLVSA